MLELFKKYKITRPVRLIELFAGYGSQALALERLGVNFQHHQVVEFDKYAIKTYNALHDTNFEPQDITQLKELDIEDPYKYEYILTYSFPCTDLSLVGKRAGMTKGSGTSSGLLWEVERLLLESKNLPHVLIMENVPAIHNFNFNEQFRLWQDFLSRLGYNNHWKDLNAKDYGIPQNRVRTFMVSVLGNYEYHFPKPFELKQRVKDLLDEDVDEKYFLSERLINTLSKKTDNYDRSVQFQPFEEPYENIAKTITTRSGQRPPDNFIKVSSNNKIRRLTPRENFRFMGLYDEDIDKIIDVNSNAQLYKQAGNSIVVNVLEHLFGELFI